MEFPARNSSESCHCLSFYTFGRLVMSRYSNQKGRYCGMCVSLLISRVGRSDCGKGKRGDNQVKQIPPIPPSPPEAIQSLSCGKIFVRTK